MPHPAAPRCGSATDRVLVDQRGLGVSDRRVGREVVDDELAQVLRVRRRDPHEVVRRAREVEHREHAGQLANDAGERLDLLARVHREPHRDHRLQGAPERGQVDIGVEAAQDAAPAQRAHAGQAGRRGDAQALGEPVVRQARVLAERLEDRAVDVVQRGMWIVRHRTHDDMGARISASRAA